MSLSSKSIKQYDNVYGIIQKGFDGAVNYDDTEKVMNIISYKENGKVVSDWTLKNRLSAVMHKSSNPVYKEKMIEVSGRLKEVSNKPETYEAKEQDFSYEDLKNAYERAKGYEKMILSLYYLMPPRRLNDYIDMIVRTEKPKRLSNSTNYLIVDGDNHYFVFNNYKTKHIYKRQTIAIPDAVWELVKDHIKDKQLFLTNPTSKAKFTDAQFSDYLRRLTMTLVGKKGSATAFRHAYTTNFLKSNPTTLQRYKMAELMAHSVGTQLSYDRRMPKPEMKEEEAD